jgi:hypothetical protein
MTGPQRSSQRPTTLRAHLGQVTTTSAGDQPDFHSGRAFEHGEDQGLHSASRRSFLAGVHRAGVLLQVRTEGTPRSHARSSSTSSDHSSAASTVCSEPHRFGRPSTYSGSSPMIPYLAASRPSPVSLPDRAVDRPPGTVIAALKAMLGKLKRAGFRCPRAERTGGRGQGDTRGTHERSYALYDRCAAQRTRVKRGTDQQRRWSERWTLTGGGSTLRPYPYRDVSKSARTLSFAFKPMV